MRATVASRNHIGARTRDYKQQKPVDCAKKLGFVLADTAECNAIVHSHLRHWTVETAYECQASGCCIYSLLCLPPD